MKLSDQDIESRIGALAGWTYDAPAKAIRRSLKFADFSQAFGFMTQVALAAEKADHHPDWSNSWNRVDIALSTHDQGGVTEKDFALAAAIDGFAAPAPGAGAD
jgi:4a-hydroxytetrahydrobiopterin dehydratase